MWDRKGKRKGVGMEVTSRRSHSSLQHVALDLGIVDLCASYVVSSPPRIHPTKDFSFSGFSAEDSQGHHEEVTQEDSTGSGPPGSPRAAANDPPEPKPSLQTPRVTGTPMREQPGTIQYNNTVGRMDVEARVRKQNTSVLYGDTAAIVDQFHQGQQAQLWAPRCPSQERWLQLAHQPLEGGPFRHPTWSVPPPPLSPAALTSAPLRP
ncbi:hypothetical protein WN55_06977 [Dufourea novaeangliae]|uniref:Uncharacterized protein n=1 Tax=Dufourea novaeangliae TaxID=178035 RepID=A0A154PQX5_DUFNO|nr:hypothetical protein WN55_06977 [Dufourea novaeangliae]